MARTKPKAMVIADMKQAEAALGRLAQLDRQLRSVDIDLQETIDQAKANAKAEADPLRLRRKELADALCAFATVNKADLFGKKRSLDLAFGTIGFRRATKLVTKAKVTLAMVLEKLRDYGFTDAIRTREAVDKEAMRGWSDDKLESVGMARRVDDDFFIEVPEELLGEEA